MNWGKAKIGDLGRVVTGKTPSKNEASYWGGNELFVSPKDLEKDQLVITQTSNTVTHRAIEKFKNQVLPRNEVMFTSLSFGFGKMGIASRQCLTNQQINSVVVNAKNDFRFVYYLLRSCTPFIFAFNSGIDTPIVPKSVFENVEVPHPPIDVQRKIAGVLSAYDDLIENNRRRIAILEKMAEEIYREWFVRMRFPGHQNAKFEKGVPVGWEVKPFNTVVDIKPTEHVVHGEEYTFVSMDNLSCSSFYFDCEEKRLHPSGSRFRNGDVLFPRITPSVENGKRGFVTCLPEGTIGVGSTEFIVMRERELCKEHLFFVTCSDSFRAHAEQSMVGASGRQRVHEKCFSSFLVKTPPNAVRMQFAKTVSPFFLSIVSLSRQNSLLERNRNSLLTRLISGKLPVDELDIQLPSSMTEDAAEETSTEVAHAE